jgi:hypothetical protein
MTLPEDHNSITVKSRRDWSFLIDLARMLGVNTGLPAADAVLKRCP